MVIGLEGVVAKLERAREHLDTLERELLEYERTSTTHLDLDIDEGNRRARIVWRCEPVPPFRLAILAGDYIHSARSALDNLVCALVHRHNLHDSCEGRAFPICDEPLKYNGRKGSELKDVPKVALSIIAELQPWQRPNATRHADPLWILNSLANRDKHRVPNIVRAFTNDAKVAVLDDQGNAIVDWRPSRLKSSVPMFVEDIPPGLKAGMQMKAVHNFTACFEDEGPWGDRPVMEVLNATFEHVVKRVVPRFEVFFQ